MSPHEHYETALIHFNGDEYCKKDEKEGLEWMGYAAKGGHPEANYQLAMIYRYGHHGVTANRSTAVDYLRKASAAGHPFAEQVRNSWIKEWREAENTEDFHRRDKTQAVVAAVVITIIFIILIAWGGFSAAD